MGKMISDQFLREERKKTSKLEKTKPCAELKEEELIEGARILVYFPVTNESKLFSNWKGVYIIKEQLDKNTFIVYEEGRSRKKYIVDRIRIRTLGEGLENISAPSPTEQDPVTEGKELPKKTIRALDEGLERIGAPSPTEVVPVTDGNELPTKTVIQIGDAEKLETVSRPQRKAKLTAKTKIKNMANNPLT